MQLTVARPPERTLVFRNLISSFTLQEGLKRQVKTQMFFLLFPRTFELLLEIELMKFLEKAKALPVQCLFIHKRQYSPVELGAQSLAQPSL